MNRTLLTLAILLAGTSISACSKNAERSAENAAASVEAATDRTGDRIENAADAALAGVTPTPTAQDFVNTAAKSDAFEIAAARLAAKNAASAEVKAFAAQMIKAHTESTTKIKAAAGRETPSVTPDATLTADQNEDLAELGRLTGAKFDEEYVDGQVEAHEEALALMRSYASSGSGAPLETAAGEIAPVVAGHLKMARDLEAKTDR